MEVEVAVVPAGLPEQVGMVAALEGEAVVAVVASEVSPEVAEALVVEEAVVVGKFFK